MKYELKDSIFVIALGTIFVMFGTGFGYSVREGNCFQASLYLFTGLFFIFTYTYLTKQKGK